MCNIHNNLRFLYQHFNFFFSTVETFLNSLEKHLPDTSITVSRPNGSSCVLQVYIVINISY